jgi:hypothetical protein
MVVRIAAARMIEAVKPQGRTAAPPQARGLTAKAPSATEQTGDRAVCTLVTLIMSCLTASRAQ